MPRLLPISLRSVAAHDQRIAADRHGRTLLTTTTAIATAGGSAAAVAPAASSDDKIRPGLERQLAADEPVDFWVRFEATADLSGADDRRLGPAWHRGRRRAAASRRDQPEVLPGYGDCRPVDVPWLSGQPRVVTLDPGQRVRVTVRLDGDGTSPGRYDSGLWIKEDTPYEIRPVDVTMRVRR